MSLSQDILDEINLLLQFPNDSLMTGIKIHHDAAPAVVAAAQRLYDKGFTSMPDGGYLTDAGVELQHHINIVDSALRPS